jgi:hypothetical protein
MAACQLPWLPERVLGRRGGQAFRDTLVRTGLDPASADRYAARARDPAVLRGPLNWYRAMPFSLREPAGPVRVPTMFAWGNRDRFVSRSAAELCGRYVTGPYRFTELDGASHWLPEQAADQVAALLAEHFAATPRQRGMPPDSDRDPGDHRRDYLSLLPVATFILPACVHRQPGRSKISTDISDVHCSAVTVIPTR